MRLSRVIIIVLILLFAAHCVYYYPLLPETLASHFGPGGEPNGWMTKQHYFIFEVGLVILLMITSLMMPKIVGIFPVKWINLPNRDYWFSGERRHETLTNIGVFHEWFGVGLMVLFVSVNQLVFNANITKQPLSSKPMWTLLTAFFVFVAFWLIAFYRKFRITEY
ncbi:MAG: DUF1648 domain-containing protein [Acidobacteria bacterium]|nr:DUF1648 domain-containing protein [Acidobacteriota bacterium]